MKTKYIFLFFTLALLFSTNVSFAQRSYEMELLNLVQINETEFRFDVRFRNTAADPVTNWIAVEMLQFQVAFNTGIFNGGAFNNTYLQYVTGTTDIVVPNPNISPITPVSANVTSDQAAIQWVSKVLGADEYTIMINHNNWVRIGTFKAILKDTYLTTLSKNYASVLPNLTLVTDGCLCNWCNVNYDVFGDGGYTRAAGAAPNLITNKTLTNSTVNKALYSHAFTGTGNYSDAARWNNAVDATDASRNQVPSVTTNNVSIGALTTVSPPLASPGICTQTGNYIVNDLTIKSTSTLTLNPAKELTVNGTMYNENSSASALTFQSTASGTGSLIHNTAGVTATVERYITAGTWADGTDGWHLLSSPVAAQAIDPEFTSSGGGEYDFYAWSEPAQVWLNQKVGANNITTFNVGQGYLAAYQNTDTKVFSGVLNIADKSVTLTQNAGTYTGWNLLGNPYSSALTWNTGWTLTNIGGVAQIWNEDIKDYSLIIAGDAIPAMNGFMVYTSAASQSLTIPAAQRVHSATAWYKSAAQQIELIAHDPQGESAKSSFIGFDSKATAGFDLEYDAYLLSGYAPKFYSVAGGSEFSLNTLPEAVSNLTIPFGFVKNASSSFSIELAQSIEGHSVWLRDLLTNTVVNLSDTPVYSFTSADGDNAARFEIVLDMFTGTSDLKALASAYAYSADNRIVVTGVNGETKMDVISIQGQVLKTFEFFSTGQHDVSVNLSTGVYLVRLYNSGEIRAMKVMVK